MKRAVIISAALLLSASGTLASTKPPFSAARKYSAAEAVVVGRVIKLVHNDFDGSEHAVVSVNAALKGFVGLKINVLIKGAREYNIPDLAVGADYTFYLTQTPNGDYQSVNGRHGVVRQDPKYPAM
ncbi:hypothetical protein AEAC466_03100 [Asticcacaulis sp. AC466]|uniref:hypothetical protein n=1 Tax=Asticcacaulis sp. AC466 TaxID=1282362 RepID=UPI0003C40E2A|nr:hypothetical protein [Asticcacaulis sp. AC466]ESQ86196.1 hypothetical protein AEAC466_03100 [Asticcacaulis sp. AC466]